MQLFIMRHGQADPLGSADPQRVLTEQGFLEAAVMAKWLVTEKIALEQVLVSPYVRAQQTAKHVMEKANVCAPFTTLDFITPSGNAQSVHDYIDGVSAPEKINNLLIVSHMPLVSYLVAELTAEHNSPIFQTAAIAQIDYDVKRMKGELVRLISPNDLC